MRRGWWAVLELAATRLIWCAAGSAIPCDSYGNEIRRRGSGYCAACGNPAEYLLADTLSENFTTVKNASRAWSFGGDSTCAACVFAARTLRLRCASWWATHDGIRFWRTRSIVSKPPELREQSAAWWKPAEADVHPDGVLELCSPPDPPFVAAIPLAGISHGGETHIMRTWWPGDPRPIGGYLPRLQSKHVAIYARVATERTRYPLQLDDIHDVVVDVPLWLDLHAEALALLSALAESGVWASSQRAALRTLLPPPGAPLALVRDWSHRTRLMMRHANSQWWPLFAGLMPIRRSDATT